MEMETGSFQVRTRRSGPCHHLLVNAAVADCWLLGSCRRVQTLNVMGAAGAERSTEWTV